VIRPLGPNRRWPEKTDKEKVRLIVPDLGAGLKPLVANWQQDSFPTLAGNAVLTAVLLPLFDRHVADFFDGFERELLECELLAEFVKCFR
jgi:hypothetical protein